MSTTALPGHLSSSDDTNPAEDRINAIVWKCIAALGSMKLTCLLFLLAMIVVLVGSLAQARRDVWQVVGQYFRTYVAWIDVADLFPPSMFPSLIDFNWASLGKFQHLPFPGGWTIGWIMLANLLTAHGLRFRVRATGSRRAVGVGILSLGALLTLIVVLVGNQQTGVEYGDSVLSPVQIWNVLLGVLGVGSILPLCVAFGKSGVSKPERIVLGMVGFLLAGVLTYFVIGGEQARLNLSSMRILWQLLKGLACAVVMLVGCRLLFEKRGGIVVLHLGVALLMVSELQVGFFAKENLLPLQEGETSAFMRDMRERELAVVHRQDGKDHVIAIPEARLMRAAAAADADDKIIDYEGLPFVVRVEKLLYNSTLRPRIPGEERTTSGLGTFATPVEIDRVTGMDDSHDMSSLTFTLLDRESGRELETLLCSQDVSEMRSVPLAEQATVDGTDYQFYLRFQRNYKDYEVKLVDVSRTNYVGTATPRDYRSQIVISDTETGNAEEFTLWMNNPLRYKGETFYQSGYTELPDGTEMTTLSVVRNTGWMLPYIACMIVAVGMFAQFGQSLGRYLSRLDRAANPRAADDDGAATSGLPAGIRAPAGGPATFEEAAEDDEQGSVWPIVIPVIAVLLCAGWLAGKARAPKEDPQAMNLYGFAQLPVAWKGRAQPVDSFARTELLVASHKSTFEGELSGAELSAPEKQKQLVDMVRRFWPSVETESLQKFQGEYNDWIEQITKLTSSGRDAVEARMRSAMVQKMPAVRWFLDVVARPESARRHRVIKIDDDQVLSLLSLEKRSGLTYSLEEILPKLSELESIRREGQKWQMAEQQHRMTQLQRRVVDLFDTVGRVEALQSMFLNRESEGMLPSMVSAWWFLGRLGNTTAIMAVPTGSENEQRSWETLLAASAIHNVAAEWQKAGLTSSSEVAEYHHTTLPRQLVSDAVEGSIEVLRSQLAESAGIKPEEVTADALRTRAREAAASMEDPFLKQILLVISDTEADPMVAAVIEDVSIEKIRLIAAQRLSAELQQVTEELDRNGDKRLDEIRDEIQAGSHPLQGKLRSLAVRINALKDMPENEAEVAGLMREFKDAEQQLTNELAVDFSQQLIQLVLDDLDERAGGLLFETKETAAFHQSTEAMIGILAAWRDGDTSDFNAGIADYRKQLEATPLPHVDTSVVSLEAFFNLFEPFMKPIYLYLMVLVLSFVSWIVWPKTLRRTGFCLMGLAFVVHTVALLMRMYISGRPPVTNLYSSAIFIGWAVVGASFFVEWFLRNGFGNILGATVGSASLVIAHYLARDEGDTLGVMQAVLDTTFWLATHVVCITLGYAATFAAGFLGMGYIALVVYERFAGPQHVLVREHSKSRSLQTAMVGMSFGGMAGMFFSQLSGSKAKIIGRRRATEVLGSTIYGVLCFALFFSLVGTVLGGLWADDSWGRFWGWDPKENGAMLIVIWNALILHARWDKMVGNYGTAVLAMFGNIVTAWSWFGVNELKAGLHTYGFTEGRLLALIVFVALQAIIIVGALIPVMGKSANQKITPA